MEDIVKENLKLKEELLNLKKRQRLENALDLQRLFGQLLIRVDNEKHLFEDICKIIVEKGKYKLAWIGFAMEDKTISPVASSGFENNYLNNIKISWGNDKYSEGPTGQAIKTGKHFVMQDIMNNPKFKPWKNAAINNGFKSSIALPLIINSKVIGAINIYSDQDNAFDEEEIKILLRSAKDLSMGISNIRQKIKIDLQTAELKKSKEVIAESEEKYRAIVENTSEWIWELDKRGIITYSNSVVEQILGYSNDDIIGENNFSLIQKIDRSRILQVFLKKVEQKKGWKNLELRWIHKDGGCRHLESSAVPILDKEGVFKGFRGINRDITERKQKDAENKKLSTVVEQSANTIIITDVKGKIEYVNPRFTEVLGYTAEEVIGKSPRILKSGKHPKEFYTQLWGTIKSGEIWKGEFQNKSKNGNLFWEQATITPIKNDEGKIINFLSIREDITIQKEAERKLKKALIKAEESDKLKSAFLANMSHEIRTPMNGIIGFSEFLLNPNLSEKKRQEYANVVIKSSKQLLAIVNDILDISKIEAGAIQLNYEPVNINKQLDDLYTFYKPRAKENNLKLYYKKGLENGESLIDIDKTKLNQILRNLLSNAFKFTKEGSIEFGYQLVEDNLHFYVKDTGVGIDKEFKNNIFDRFSQGKRTINELKSGTGLGLAISKNFVELFNGKIWFTTGDEGTTMNFTIPYIRKNKPIITAFLKEEKKETKVEHKKITILVAEDEDYNMMYLNELFSKTNFEIIEAINGKQAVELFEKHPEIDIVLMDIQMPIMDGSEAMKEIRRKKPSLPIIAISAFAMESDKKMALENGFSEYLSKPIDRKLLFNILNKYSNQVKDV